MQDTGHSVPIACSEQSWDVLKQDVPWSKDAKTFDDVIPYPPFILYTLPSTSMAYGLAGEACRHHINLLELLPI